MKTDAIIRKIGPNSYGVTIPHIWLTETERDEMQERMNIDIELDITDDRIIITRKV